VQILQNDGAALAASVNALTLALQNAGIPMRDMLCACSVGLGEQSTPVLDLNFSERQSDTPEVTVASLVHADKIVLLTEENKLNAAFLQPMLQLALQANHKLFAILKQETKSYSEAILRSRGIINA
jgi:exosome complex component RRP41